MEIKNYLKNLDPYRAKLEQSELQTKRNAARKEGDAASSAQGDRVSLSDEAKLRTEAYSAALAAPDVRQEKVDALKSKVESGEYQVDSRAVAEKLLKEEQDLFG
ncbi:MAG TPA: flagellar biosynthesis anti-sigma factor FlgM [Desulfovibrio sp.]|jgi:negative regulator of flagellin synthesis FlgM|nr:anti-sigma-28 factor, FlgM family protein [Desulfovibrio sp. A2]HCG03843.1 flagellar biosynthesis anti-sigma factor FlgM [Desulfovibrio sp.]